MQNEELKIHIIPENKLEEFSSVSSSGKYKLEISEYKTGKSTWNISRGILMDKDGSVKQEIIRDYGHFPYYWFEKEGKDYLIWHYHYEGFTIVDLESNISYAHKDYFCPVNYSLSPNKKTLAVEGCYWACPHETQFFDISDLNNIKQIPFSKKPNNHEYVPVGDTNAWIGDDVYVVKSFNSNTKELEEEWACYYWAEKEMRVIRTHLNHSLLEGSPDVADYFSDGDD